MQPQTTTGTPDAGDADKHKPNTADPGRPDTSQTDASTANYEPNASDATPAPAPPEATGCEPKAQPGDGDLIDDTPRHIIEHPKNIGRAVSLICGPPGAGKTTLGLQLHRATLDIGDLPPGTPQERMRLFGLLAWRVGRDRNANVAVIRGAPKTREREHQQKLCRPARTIIMLTDADECHRRIAARNRPGVDGRDLAGQHSAVDTWWAAWVADGTHQVQGTTRQW